MTKEEVVAKQKEAQYKAYLQHLKKENALMEEQIKYYQYQMALPKLHAEWERMQKELAAAAPQPTVAEVPEVTTEEMGS